MELTLDSPSLNMGFHEECANFTMALSEPARLDADVIRALANTAGSEVIDTAKSYKMQRMVSIGMAAALDIRKAVKRIPDPGPSPTPDPDPEPQLGQATHVGTSRQETGMHEEGATVNMGDQGSQGRPTS